MSEHHRSNMLPIAVGVVAALAIVAGAVTGAHAYSVGRAKVLEQKIYFSHAFVEPLVPIGSTTENEDKALFAVITRYKVESNPGDLTPIDRFLTNHLHTAWRVALSMFLTIPSTQSIYLDFARRRMNVKRSSKRYRPHPLE